MTSEEDVKVLDALYDKANAFSRDVVRDGLPDFHFGFYRTPTDDAPTASSNAVRELVRLGESVGAQFGPGARVVDLGAGMGGTAHLLARECGCHVTCLNILESQNRINRDVIAALGIQDRVRVVPGSFDALPADWADAFDTVISMDSIIHSANKPAVAREFARVAKPGGFVLLTDIMGGEFAPAQAMEAYRARNFMKTPILTLDAYENLFRDAGLVVLRALDWSANLVPWLRHLCEKTHAYAQNVAGEQKEYLEKRAASYMTSIDGLHSAEGQSWGILVCYKPRAGEGRKFRDVRGRTLPETAA